MTPDRQKKQIEKMLAEITPERSRELNNAFRGMQRHNDDVQPMMRQTHFGGSYNFDVNRKQVDLEGTFSKEDLLRIAMVLE